MYYYYTHIMRCLSSFDERSIVYDGVCIKQPDLQALAQEFGGGAAEEIQNPKLVKTNNMSNKDTNIPYKMPNKDTNIPHKDTRNSTF